jgi:hypothetical protein
MSALLTPSKESTLARTESTVNTFSPKSTNVNRSSYFIGHSGSTYWRKKGSEKAEILPKKIEELGQVL